VGHQNAGPDAPAEVTVAGLLGRKLGMTQVFDPEDGHVERVTVLEVGPCYVTGIRRVERDGYDAVQVGFGAAREKRLTKGQLGHLKKAGVPAVRHVREFRGEPGELEVGAEVKLEETFEKGQQIKVSGTSKGKGFQGTVKRHNFTTGPKSHGSHNVRQPGAIGASATPSRVFKGIRGPGQMGNKRVTQRGLEVVEVRADDNLLLVRGAVPGPKGAVVEIRTED
jgi:large subunit ribosomal protein L3